MGINHFHKVFDRWSPQTVPGSSLCGHYTPVNLASVFGARLPTENQVYSPKLPPKYILPKHICCAGELDGCCYHPLLLGRTWARAVETQSPWILNGLSYQEKNSSYVFMAFPIPTRCEIMQKRPLQDSRNTPEVAELEPSELLMHVASGTVFSTWSLGVIQIIPINFYTGVSPADALSPKCLETICFLEWGQNSHSSSSLPFPQSACAGLLLDVRGSPGRKEKDVAWLLLFAWID